MAASYARLADSLTALPLGQNEAVSTVLQEAPLIVCGHCSFEAIPGSSFCGNCGQKLGLVQPIEFTVSESHVTPAFAKVHAHQSTIPEELKQELSSLVIQLAQQRIFFLWHCSVFLVVNLTGFWLSLCVYTNFLGDEVTKVVISLTPIMFINSFGLLAVVPVQGTKREIDKLKDRITYVRYKIEYSNLL